MKARIQLSSGIKDIRLRPAFISQAEAVRREQAGYERGRIEGEAAVNERLLQQRAELLELQNGVFAQLQQVLPQLIGECESALIELSVAMAERVVSGMPVTADVLLASIREALKDLAQDHQIRVKVNPEDLELLRKMSSSQPEAKLPTQVELVAANEVGRGGCVVETRFGVIDATRETKWRLLREAALG